MELNKENPTPNGPSSSLNRKMPVVQNEPLACDFVPHARELPAADQDGSDAPMASSSFGYAAMLPTGLQKPEHPTEKIKDLI